MIEVLRGAWDVGLDLNGLFEEADGGVGSYFKGKEVVIVRRSCYADGDAPRGELVAV